MYSHEITIRVRYGETDAMGCVYHGNYAEWLEVARVELLRKIGMPYTDFEQLGILMPVVEMQIRYLKPAFYDEVITIKTFLDEMPGLKTPVRYELYNAERELITTAKVVLVAYDRKRRRPCLPPDYFITLLYPYFQSAVNESLIGCA